VAGILGQQAASSDRLNRHSRRIDDMEIDGAKKAGNLRVVERVAWAIVTAGVGALFAAAKSGVL
jgi:hypothetical protein